MNTGDELNDKYMNLCNEYKSMLLPNAQYKFNNIINQNNDEYNNENDNKLCEESINTIYNTIRKYTTKKDGYLKNIDQIDEYIKLIESHIEKISILKFSLNSINNMNLQVFKIDNISTTNTMNKINDLFNNDEIQKLYCTINALNNIKDEYFQNIKNLSNFISNYKKLLKSNLEDDKDSLNKYFNKNICSICYDKEITTCCDPCGHTYCTDCVKKITKKCYICNEKCKNKIKLFIAGTTDTNDTNNIINAISTNNFSNNNYSFINNDDEHNRDINDLNNILNNIAPINTIGYTLRSANLTLNNNQ